MTANDLPQTVPQAPAPAPASVTAPTVAAQGQQAPTTSFGQRWLEHQDSQFLASMRQAVQSDPDTYAESQKLSRQLGVPQETAERDDGYLRKLGRAIQVRNYNLGRTSPTLYRALQDLDFAKKAQDDIESLTLSESVAKAWKIGRLTADRGTYNLMEAQGQLAPEESMWLRGVEQYLRDNREPAGFIPGLAGVMGQVAQTLPNAVEKGLATALGTAAVGAAIPIPDEVVTLPTAFSVGFVSGMAQSAYQVEAGNAWRDMLDAGYNPERAAYAATAVGMVNAALEMAGAKMLTAPVRVALKQQLAAEIRQRIADRVAGNALWSFARTYGSSVGGEIGTEIGQEVVNILGELYAADGKGDVGPIASRLADIAWQTFEGTALLGVPGAAASARQTKQRAAMAKEFEAQVRAQFQAAADAKMAQRDPDSLAQFIRDGGNDGQPMVAYVDAATLRDVLRQKDAEATDNGGGLTKSLESRLNEVSPGITDRITEAAAAGGSVELDVADLAAKMGKDADVLTPHLRREPNAPSAAEAEAADKEAQQAGEADTGTDAEKAKAEALDKVRKEIEESLRTTVDKAGATVTQQEVRDAAKATASIVESFADRDNTTPEKWWAANKPAFAVASDAHASPDVLSQPSPVKTDTPEFRAWFGDSKVVDEAGKPLVVYHGTKSPTEDMAFDFSKIGANGRAEGAGFYFTTDQRIAEGYATGTLLKTWLAIKKPMPFDQKGFTATQLRKIVKRAAELEAEAEGSDIRDGFLSNYGDTYTSLSGAIADAAKLIAADERAVDQMGGMVGSGLSPEFVNKAVTEVTGFDGIVSKGFGNQDRGGGTIYVAFQPEQVKSVNNRGTFDPNDPNILRQPARGLFDPKSLTVLLTSKSDATTIFHELNHWAVETMLRIAAQPNGSPSIKADVDVLLKRWGVSTVEEWAALPSKTRAMHLEDIAYNFEDWLATGEAPSSDLRGVFERIKAILVRVYTFVRETLNRNYRAEFGTDLPALTPELRGVFDRMLASQAAIEQAIAEREGAALFDVQKDAKALGITEDEARLLRILDEERRAEAVSRVQAEAMRGTRYIESQRRSEESKLHKQAREKRAELREQVQKEVAGQPVYRAMAWINAGEVDNNGTMESAKLDADAVKSILGPDAALIPRSLTKARGQSPDLTAEMFGFRTGHDLLRAIIGALPMEQAVEARVDERMDAEFGSLSDPKKMQQAIEEALHTKAATRYAATILRALLKSTQPTVVLEAAAMSVARAILRSTPISQISPRLYAAAESRAVKAMRKALASGDVKEAIDATRKWLLQHSLTRLSLDVQKEVDKFVEGTVEKVLQPDQKIIDGKRNLDVVMAARAVLGERDLAPGRRFERALNYLESLRELNAAEFESLSASVSALDQFGRKGYRELTLDEFRVLSSTVEALWERAKRVEQYASWDGEMLLRAEVRDRLVQAGIEGGLGKPGTPDFAAEARTWTWDNFLANLRRIESWTISVDGKDGGYWHRYIYRKLAKAYNDYQEISLDGQRWWSDLAATVDNLNGQKIDASAWLGTGVVFRNREHLLGALIHHGNSSNRTAMLEGEGWTEAGWFSFLDAMQENGTLTKADFDAVQAVWDRNDKVYRPLMQGVNRKVYGTYFEEVKAEPFQTRFGTYRGGYAPAKVDPDRNADISTRGGFQAIADGEQQFKQSFANAPRGSTIKRTGVRRPRLLSFQAQGQHIDEVARFLAMSEALRDVAGLFTGGKLVDYLNNVAPAAIKSIIAPAVERMARNQIVAPMNGSGGAKIVGSVATWLRRSTSMNALGFNIRNALQQYTGIANAIQYTGAGRFWSSLWSYVTNGTGMANEAMAESKMMRNRLSQEAAKLAEDLALMFDPSLLGKVSRWANHYGYWAQRKTQMQVDVTTWHAARQKAYAELLPTMGPEKARIEAIERADSVVRRSQGARTPLDIASFSGGNAVMQLFTQFSDYPNLVLNQILEQRGLARQAGAVLMVLLIPSLASGAIALSMAGFRAPGSKSKDGDDDKDGRYDDDMAAYLFGQTLRGVGSLLPVAGPAITDAVFAGEQAVDRAQPFAAWSVAQSMLRLIAGGRSASLAWSEGQPTEFGAQDARDVATVFGALGLPMSGPLGRAWSYIEQVDAGKVEPVNGFDYMRGLVNGR